MNNQSRQFAADTHPGVKRSQNQDCYEAAPELGLWLVADGVGGHSYGEVASEIVRSTIRDGIARGESLLQAIKRSHQAILDTIEQEDSTRGMGSTVVALTVEDNHYEISWVGDSRAYLWNSQLQQLTFDHNRVSELLASKVITPQQATDHPERHVLTQSLGVSDKMSHEPGQISGELNDGEQILLCSDGLTDELSDGQIARLMAEASTPQEQVDALIKAALDAGGSDNVTVVVVGECVKWQDIDTENLETTHNIARAANSGNEGRGGFPLTAVIVLSAIALLTLWFML